MSVRLKKVFVRFNPMQFGCFAPQIHREDVMHTLARALGGPPSPKLRRTRSSLDCASLQRRLERVTRLELATSTLARWCSTN